MIPCTCSLRSKQCAALIALATAAGIARIESVGGAAPHRVPATERRGAETHATGTVKPVFFQLSTDRPAPWVASVATLAAWCLSLPENHLVPHEQTASGSACWLEAPDAQTGIAASVSVSTVSYGFRAVSVLSVRQHHFPYAIGPPLRAAQSLLRADGTRVPGDSAARRSSRVAASFADFRFARVTRRSLPGSEIAGPFFLPIPSFTPRGERGFSSCQTPACAIPARVNCAC